MNKPGKLVIKQDAETEVPIEVMAESIKIISEGIRKMRQGRLKDKALFLLIQNAAPCVSGRYGNSKIGITEVKAVIQGIESLEREYLK